MTAKTLDSISFTCELEDDVLNSAVNVKDANRMSIPIHTLNGRSYSVGLTTQLSNLFGYYGDEFPERVRRMVIQLDENIFAESKIDHYLLQAINETKSELITWNTNCFTNEKNTFRAELHNTDAKVILGAIVTAIQNNFDHERIDLVGLNEIPILNSYLKKGASLTQ